MKPPRAGLLLAGLWALALSGCFDSSSDSDHEPPASPDVPNILFIVLDDVGVDQFEAFGYGGAAPAQTRNIDDIANAGVRFRNTWSMPTCSPTRATFFDGRYPFRTNVLNAVVSDDLANSQVSPYALTTPKLLRQRGYDNAVIGKMHLTGSDLNRDNHPPGDGAMRDLGWDYFNGYLDGGPYPIDTTAGGVAASGTYQCGFVPNQAADPVNGANHGVCYLADGGHRLMSAPEFPTPGRTCLERGGILDPGSDRYSEARRQELDFDTQNGYYTGEWKINRADGDDETHLASDPRARGYRLVKETDKAIDWIGDREPGKPWMLSLGYSALHTPLQPPPTSLLPDGHSPIHPSGCGTPAGDTLAEVGALPEALGEALGDATDLAEQRLVTRQMLEALDHEIGRLLETTGIATRQEDGSLQYHPDSNTVVVVVGDNGTYAPSVKLPFDASRAKGTPYQSGVWVPLIVAGPMVSNPDRDVSHLINTTDLFSLFGELAGLDMARLPPALQLDAQPMLAYLTEPGRESIRATNFTEQGTNITATDADPPSPCVIPAADTCVQIFPQQGVCEDQGGTWYGPGHPDGPDGFDSCCAVNDYLASEGEDTVGIMPDSQRALRNDDYKLVRVGRLDCATQNINFTDEFYEVNESTDPSQLKIDTAEDNLLDGKDADALTPEQRDNFIALRSELDQLLASAIDCPGDGNGDLQVDERDLAEWQRWADTNGGHSSWYDFNHDGVTDDRDRDVIEAHFGTDCRP